MISVDASDLKKEINSLAEFLHSKLQTSIMRKGKMLVIEDSETSIKTKDVKIYLKRFLHDNELSGKYRVIVDRTLIRVVKVKAQKRSKARNEEGLAPHPAETMPWYYPWRT